jgi:hypothetical protein
VTERFRCAHLARAVDEPMFATASTVRRWLLVEQPGPWGVDAIRESRLPAATAAGLTALGRRLRARVLLVRRHRGRASAGCAAFAAVSGVRTQWAEAFDLEAPRDVLDLDLDALRDGRSVGGRVLTDPLLLVCTNGRHDPCCAEYGRPVAAALEAAHGDRVWEVSHIGGDRFAGNVVVLPDAVYYGGLDAERSVEVVARHLAGHLDLDAYRGRSAYPFVVQAAEHLLRTARGLTALGAVRWRQREQLADDRWRVTFATSDGPAAVELEVGTAAAPRRLTCRAPAASAPPRYRLVAITA